MENRKFKVAVIGATGAVGQVFMWMLSDHPWFELSYVTASAARVGQKYAATVHWVMPFEMPDVLRDMEVRELNFEAMKKEGVQIVFSALPAAVAREAEPQMRANGFYVFSNAAAMRYDKDVPILIPETNSEQLELIRNQGYPQTGFCVTNANCVTTGLAMALAPLRKFGIKTITINSYQSVSGAGYPGLSSFDITDNCIPYIGGEEEKIEKEIKKILSIDPDVYAYTAARLASGTISFEQVGAKLDKKDVVCLSVQPAQKKADSIIGNIDILDTRYGSLWTNIPKSLLDEEGICYGDSLLVSIANADCIVFQTTLRLCKNFTEAALGKPLLYINSLLNLAVALNQGSFSSHYHIGTGEGWHITVKKSRGEKNAEDI